MTSTINANPTPQPSAEMLRMLNAFLTVQALHVAAFLGLADLLAAGSKTVDELAAADRIASLHRLLRMLTGPGVFREEADGRFAITPLGATLRSDDPDSVREWALFVGAPEMWAVWAGLRASVMSGEASFTAIHGTNVGLHRSPPEPGRGVQWLDDAPVKAAQLRAGGRLRLFTIPPRGRRWRRTGLYAGGRSERSSVA